jgi:hypothetical protein
LFSHESERRNNSLMQEENYFEIFEDRFFFYRKEEKSAKEPLSPSFIFGYYSTHQTAAVGSSIP